MSLDQIQTVIDTWTGLGIWLALVAACVAWVIYDLRTSNNHIASMMQWVWVLTVLYSGPIGLLIYRFSGRKQIPTDSIARKGFRSVAHCYSGCGIGEILGVIISVGLFALGNFWAAIITFSLAYIFGFALNIGPMMQNGMAFKEAFKGAFVAESISIVVMEFVAITTDLYKSTMNDALFWSSLYISLSLGLFAAWPANLLLIKYGLKGGMGDPRDEDAAAHAHCH
ncbi:MAG: multicopper oxidase-like protein [Marinobacter sp. T13-3]|nr:MAG: multicopper oxidase-like protein [Marinobacter sp. T13-3]